MSGSRPSKVPEDLDKGFRVYDVPEASGTLRNYVDSCSGLRLTVSSETLALYSVGNDVWRRHPLSPNP